VKSEVEEIVSRPFSVGSGEDWTSLVRTIVENWAHRIGHLHLILSNATSIPSKDLNLTRTLEEVQLLTYSPLMPYMDVSCLADASGYDIFFAPQPSHPDKSALDRCATQYGHLRKVEDMSSQEELLRVSLETVQRRICLDFGTIFAESVDKLLLSLDSAAILERIKGWLVRMEKLSRYLDWPTEYRCEETCARDVSAFSAPTEVY
jgi:hypothetical protein